jgi:SAM-dependent methyltransferase
MLSGVRPTQPHTPTQRLSVLPARLRAELARLRRRLTGRGGYYERVRLDAADIETERYKRFIPGGAERWEQWGRFQLDLLQQMGLQPFHRVLDIGCGPARAGVHLIRYLDPGCYVGVDYNPDFLRAARHIVTREGLEARQPRFHRVDDFDFSGLEGDFHFGLAFALINHCNRAQRRRFLAGVTGPLGPGAKLYVTHARVLGTSALEGTSLRITRRFGNEAELRAIPGGTGDGAFGCARVFPILELTRG